MQYKVIVIGDSGVGKTCILLRYVDTIFKSSHISTIGKLSDFATRSNIFNHRVKLLSLVNGVIELDEYVQCVCQCKSTKENRK